METLGLSCCFLLQGPNSVMIVLVMLLNIGLAILFVHFLT